MAEWERPPDEGPSEFDHGPGLFPNPNVTYDPQGSRSGFPNVRPQGVGLGTSDENFRDKMAGMRSNVNDPNETLEDMYYAAGNPDRYGPNPPIVKQGPEILPPDPDLEPIVRFERAE